MTERVIAMGESVPLDAYIRNLRTMARLTPFAGTRAFYRDLLRNVIRETREQRSERAEHREAA
jgi:hypothetical protein